MAAGSGQPKQGINNMQDMILAQTDKLTMSSREIAELTGKRHPDVKRDIVNMLHDLVEVVSDFAHIYFDSMNREQTEYLLDRDHTDCLLTGYSAKARMLIIQRWRELEAKQAPQLPGTFAEALQLAADQAKQLELAAPKVAFVEKLVERDTLMTATQVGQKHGMSAIKLNKFLDELGGVYTKNVKRSRAFLQPFIDKGYGELKQNEAGHSQALFTPAGEVWINEQLISEGVV